MIKQPSSSDALAAYPSDPEHIHCPSLLLTGDCRETVRPPDYEMFELSDGEERFDVGS